MKLCTTSIFVWKVKVKSKSKCADAEIDLKLMCQCDLDKFNFGIHVDVGNWAEYEKRILWVVDVEQFSILNERGFRYFVNLLWIRTVLKV